MKRAILVILSLMLVLSLGLAPAAALPKDSLKIQKVLKPEKGSDIILDKVELIKDDDQASVKIKGHVTKKEGSKAFYIDIDAEKGTYKTTKAISQEKISRKKMTSLTPLLLLAGHG